MSGTRDRFLVAAWYFTILGGMAPSVSCAQDAEFASDFPLALTSHDTVVGQDQGFGVLLDAELGPDGTVYVVDMNNAQVVAITPTGEVAWRVGRAGQGPGEFRTIYRVTVGPDGTVFVLDRNGNAISRFNDRGEFIDRRQLMFTFEVIDDFVVDARGFLAIAGITSYGVPSDSAIHVFDGELVHVRSFAPVPPAKNRMTLSFNGAGALTLTPEGDIVFVRRLPYEIYRYGIDGAFQGKIAPPTQYDVTADDAVIIEERAGGIRIRRPEVEIPRFQPPRSLGGGLIISGRVEGDERYWDVFDYAGEHRGTTRVPVEWGSVVGYDPERQILWTKGTRMLEPVLRPLRVTLKREIGG